MTDSDSRTRRSVLTTTAAAGAAALGLGVAGRAGARRGTGPDPVLLVHGYMDTGETPWWDVVGGYFEDVGYDSSDVHVLSLGDVPGTTTDSPAEYGRVVARELDRIHEETRREVDVVSHSMGGLDSRWAIEREGAASLVDDLVTLGSPHQGTNVAYVGLLTPGGRDMIPGSTLLNVLNDDGLADGVEYTAIWSHADLLISPNSNATIPRYMLSHADGRNVNVGYRGHMQLVFDRDVFDRYVEYL